LKSETESELNETTPNSVTKKISSATKKRLEALKSKKEESVPTEIKPIEEKPKDPPKSIFKQSKNPNFRFDKAQKKEPVIEILADEDDNREKIV